MNKWIVLLALSTVACGPPVRGAIDASGYAHNDYDLRVASTNKELMPKGWKLDNYYWGKDKQGNEELKPKDTADYKTEYAFDFDGDDEPDTTAQEFIYDLRFTHAEHDGRVFLRTLPLSVDQGKKRLNVLLNRYLEAMAGAGYEVVKFGETRALVEKRYAVAVKATEESTLGGREALVAHLEVANLDQIKIDPNARKEQVALVLVRTGFKYVKQNKYVKHNQSARSETVKYPVLLIAGYANQPEDFREGLKDFWGFLGRVKIDGKVGFEKPTFGDQQTGEKGAGENTGEPKQNKEGQVEEAPKKPAPTSEENKVESGNETATKPKTEKASLVDLEKETTPGDAAPKADAAPTGE